MVGAPVGDNKVVCRTLISVVERTPLVAHPCSMKGVSRDLHQEMQRTTTVELMTAGSLHIVKMRLKSWHLQVKRSNLVVLTRFDFKVVRGKNVF